ncbi:4-amino-4-deoxychorismate lyase [Anaerobacillus alkaliphilus]|uniref:4-amino-4-deoxychorismate lyase n=1 Tax=Anaerobacillus alkaliphilus TaxID=1548597 RepID=A0A4Q0VTC4_9BACI|nr:aminodeoxychorismate lyase [Anaerobacillus alkaliphilus]RXJ01085.1 4-amino-4-deoxychorismate lyase [Anaerobacillus alkaliphilus]
MFIYINGEFIEENEARISPFDHGFLYGVGVFETFRIYNGHPFLLDDHFQRLVSSLRELNIHYSMDKEQILQILNRLLLLNNLTDAYVRFNISAGEAPIGLQTEAYVKPNVIIFMKPLNAPLAREKKAVLLNTVRNTPEGEIRYKSHHYLNNIFGKREAPAFDTEGIFLTKEGFLAEGVVSNLFWVKNGQVFTPSVQTGILNGITRRFVMSILKLNKISCREGFYKKNELLEADEIFVTNSIQEVVAITVVDNQRLTAENNLTKFLQDIYSKYTKQNVRTIKELERG